MVRISLTPVIDVVFILLIFFMLATNFQKFNQVDIKIATETAAPSQEDKETFIVKFDNSGNYKLNDASYSLDDLKEKIKASVSNSPDYLVILKPSEKTNLQSMFKLLESLHQDKIKNVSMGVIKNEIKEKNQSK